MTSSWSFSRHAAQHGDPANYHIFFFKTQTTQNLPFDDVLPWVIGNGPIEYTYG